GRARELAQRKRTDAYDEVALWEQQAAENVEAHRIREEEQQKAADALTIWLDDFAPRRRTRPEEITSAMLKTELDDELRYHRHRGVIVSSPEHPDAITYAPSHYKNKGDKIAALKKALAAEISLNGEPMDVDDPNSTSIDVEMV
ncbi:hypothetical protein AURDEDRAFT_177276, partial [Auricularia subglabra TFB-10046 SS5]